MHDATANWPWVGRARGQVRNGCSRQPSAVYPGRTEACRVLLIGSHLDTVPNAGAYDGILGVVLGVALLTAQGRALPFAIEVVGFSEEEGVRFGLPFIGSRALVGSLDEDLLGRRDAEGISIREAIADFGLDPAEIAEAAIRRCPWLSGVPH